MRLALCAWFLLLSCATAARSQEVRYVDLLGIKQRTTLRYPPPPPAQCTEKGCAIAGYSAGASVGDGAPDVRDPHALGVYLLSVAPSEASPENSLRTEFRVLNTGTVPIDVPVFPHLSDLQPTDPLTEFVYLSMTLVVRPEDPASPLGANPLAMLSLYGASERPDSILTLKPGEWLRVRAESQLRFTMQQETSVRVQGGFWLQQVTFRAQPTRSSENVRNLYPNSTRTPALELHLVPPSSTNPQSR